MIHHDTSRLASTLLRPHLALSAALLLALGGCDGVAATPDAGPMGDAGDPPMDPDAGADPDAGPPPPTADPAVYTMSNDPAGNAVLAFARAGDGSLTALGSYATGGLGSGDGLGSQNALVYDPAQGRVFVVNAGDDTVSMLALEEDGSLTLESTVSAGGVRPVSITSNGDVAYVVNAGDETTPANISGFRISATDLVPIDGSSRPLSADAVGPGQIEFSPDGALLFVTEKGENRIDTFTVEGGVAHGPMVQPSAGLTPFGFAFSDDGQLIVSEAFGGGDGLGASSSYALDTLPTTLSTVSSSVASGQSAPCWVVLVGDYAYVTNTASDNVTAYEVGADGSLALTWSAPTGDAPIDAAATEDGELLYVLNAGDDSIGIFDVTASTGALSAQPDFTGLPATAVGLAVGPNAVYTLSNAESGNEVLAYVRSSTGSLSSLGAYGTGGAGSGAGLGSQGALVVDADGGRLFAVNAGDDTISMFTIESSGALSLASTVDAGGVSPRSITARGDLVYVVNAGDDETPANVAGFRVAAGALTPIADSSRPLSADDAGPGQVELTADGRTLVVTEKGTSRISLYAIDAAGVPTGPVASPSNGMTPFGFAFTEGGALIVSEAFGGMEGLGAASAYTIGSAGSLSVVSGSVGSSQSAPCWVVIAGDYAYVTNTRTDNLSAYRIGDDGALSLEWNAETGAGPIDAAVSEDDGFLYVLNGGDDSLSIYAVDTGTGLLMEQPAFTGLPEAAVGLVAR